MVAHLQRNDVKLMNDSPRRGLEGWKLVDIDPDETFGLMTQLVDPS